MLKSKKLFAIIMILIVSLGSMTCVVNAADNPSYLYDGIDYYWKIDPRGNNIPGSSNVLYLPGDSATFSYDFTNYSTQYSDFVISPQNAYTGIRMFFSASTETHTLNIQVVRKDTGAVVYNNVFSVFNGFEQEFCLTSNYLESGRGYYIKLSNPSKAAAKGNFRITE